MINYTIKRNSYIVGKDGRSDSFLEAKAGSVGGFFTGPRPVAPAPRGAEPGLGCGDERLEGSLGDPLRDAAEVLRGYGYDKGGGVGQSGCDYLFHGLGKAGLQANRLVGFRMTVIVFSWFRNQEILAIFHAGGVTENWSKAVKSVGSRKEAAAWAARMII